MTEPFVRPDVRAYLDMLAQNPRPAMSDALIPQLRSSSTALLRSLDLPMGDLAEVRDLTMPSPAGDIALRLYDARVSRAAGPVVVFYHGGGFIAGSIDTHDGLAATIARVLDLPVVSVEYRLAPEDKWPAAPDDCEAAARWIAANGAAFGREFTHLVLCGDSAGGNLALIAAADLRDAPAAVPVLATIPIYPLTDDSRVYESRRAFGSGNYGLDSKSMDYFGQAYAGEGCHPRHSPLLGDLAGLPPMLLVTAALDPLRDEGRAYAAAAVEAGVPVIYREYAGMIHGFCSYRKAIPSAAADTAAFLALAKAMIDEALG